LENENSFFNIETDETNKLKKLFFSTERMTQSLQNYRDKILLDSTYKTNRFNMLLAVISGISENGKILIFGNFKYYFD